jgi:hypothetical protein
MNQPNQDKRTQSRQRRGSITSAVRTETIVRALDPGGEEVGA